MLDKKDDSQEDVIRTMAWVTFASQILHATVTVNLEKVGSETMKYEKEMTRAASIGADVMLEEFDRRFR